ncbi:hypothetical protein KP509_01G006800 [Ceratopteris richardii]|uniref:Uncharacterized protein n=1 Tax=Ceratopteris richardii TaxID=49495 RepID=A0A8T2VE83_CERRI|nr:hypothetical protein KP509_01G006800 [Ceratopteris richardii]
MLRSSNKSTKSRFSKVCWLPSRENPSNQPFPSASIPFSSPITCVPPKQNPKKHRGNHESLLPPNSTHTPSSEKLIAPCVTPLVFMKLPSIQLVLERRTSLPPLLPAHASQSSSWQEREQSLPLLLLYTEPSSRAHLSETAPAVLSTLERRERERKKTMLSFPHISIIPSLFSPSSLRQKPPRIRRLPQHYCR